MLFNFIFNKFYALFFIIIILFILFKYRNVFLCNLVGINKESITKGVCKRD